MVDWAVKPQHRKKYNVIHCSQAKKLKRIRRVLSDEEDSDKEGEQAEDAEERIAQELFEGQGEEGEEDLDDVASQRRATEKEFEDLNVEGSEEESGWFSVQKTSFNPCPAE